MIPPRSASQDASAIMDQPVTPPIAPLFVPGNRPERFSKAEQSEADAVIIDLEDAVAPDQKEIARNNLTSHGVSAKPVFARINARGSVWWDADIAALAEAKIDGVMVAKAETPEDIADVHKGVGRRLPAIALVETAAAFANLRALLGVPGVLCGAFGSLDYALDVGCDTSWEALLLPRSMLALESRIAGLPAPIDGVTPQFDDDITLRRESSQARALGYRGKLAIHPRQILTIKEAFLPSPKEIEWAKTIIAVSEGNPGAVKIEGSMIDLPVIKRAERILSLSVNS